MICWSTSRLWYVTSLDIETGDAEHHMRQSCHTSSYPWTLVIDMLWLHSSWCGVSWWNVSTWSWVHWSCFVTSFVIWLWNHWSQQIRCCDIIDHNNFYILLYPVNVVMWRVTHVATSLWTNTWIGHDEFGELTCSPTHRCRKLSHDRIDHDLLKRSVVTALVTKMRSSRWTPETHGLVSFIELLVILWVVTS